LICLLTALSLRLSLFQLLHTLAYLHSQGIYHRDVKPDNLIYHPPTRWLTLIDFNFASRVDINTGEATDTTPWAAAGERLCIYIHIYRYIYICML